MKAVILAAGKATRLRPVTLTMPKALVPVANKLLIQYAIDALKGAGIHDIGIVVNDLDSPICTQLGDGSQYGVRLEYIVQPEAHGLAHAVKLCQSFVGSDPFCVFLGDNIFHDKMTAMFRDFEQSDAEAVLALGEVADPTRFGIAEIVNGTITAVVEKPQNPPSNLAIAGVYLFRSSIFGAIDRIKPSWRNEYEITDAIQMLITESRRVKAYKLNGWWIDAGKPDSIIQANQLVLSDLPRVDPNGAETVIERSVISAAVSLGKNCQIIGSVIRGPVIIGDNTTIKNSYIGPYTALGDNVAVEGSEIENSVVMSNCLIRDIAGRIDSSLLAYNSQVIATKTMPMVHRLILSENCYIQL